MGQDSFQRWYQSTDLSCITRLAVNPIRDIRNRASSILYWLHRFLYGLTTCSIARMPTIIIVLIFCRSLISQIWNRSRNLFNENLSHCTVTPMDNMNSRNLFNEFLQNSNSRIFRPVKYKRHTVLFQRVKRSRSLLEHK